ncbi:MAG: hypothetical protein ACFFCH_03480 [Promethearchaeota archaeon]
MTHIGFQLGLPALAAQIDFVDSLLNLIFGAFGLIFVVFIAIFVGIFIFAFYMICKSMRTAARGIEMPEPVQIDQEPGHEKQLIRESLPAECPTCDAPLKYNEVKWTGPRQAECPYCGTAVELEETIVGDS